MANKNTFWRILVLGLVSFFFSNKAFSGDSFGLGIGHLSGYGFVYRHSTEADPNVIWHIGGLPYMTKNTLSLTLGIERLQKIAGLNSNSLYWVAGAGSIVDGHFIKICSNPEFQSGLDNCQNTPSQKQINTQFIAGAGLAWIYSGFTDFLISLEVPLSLLLNLSRENGNYVELIPTPSLVAVYQL